MKAIAAFVMRGTSRAALVAAAAALLSVLFPPVGLFGGASIGLVTLRNGLTAGLRTGAVGAVGMGALAWLTLGSALPVLGVLALLWLPVLGLALILRYSRSLGLTVRVAGAFGVVALLGVYLAVPDPAAVWLELLEPVRAALVRDGLIEDSASGPIFAQMAVWMTGALIAALLAQVLFALFIARWWQALLYNPGGFGAEFRELRLGPWVGGFVAVWLLLLPLVGGSGPVVDLLLVSGLLLVLQGLAVAHQVRRARGVKVGWLVALYALIVLLMPQALLLIACIGFVDIWADIRSRVGRGGGPPRSGASSG